MAPDPKPRRRHGHRRGVEPAGLRRWRLAHSRKADPRPRRRRRRSYDPAESKPVYTGSRGGRYWQGPTRRRYDPPQRRRFGSARKYGSKVEGGLAKYGAWLGAGLAALVGIGGAYSRYSTAYGADAANKYWTTIVGGDSAKGEIPEIAHLWQTDARYNINQFQYLAYKFLGQNVQGAFGEPSAWVMPFWGSLIAFVTGLFLKRSGKGSLVRIGKILQPMGTGGLVVSTIGALALPGCPESPHKVITDYGGRQQQRLAPPTVLPYQFVGQNEGAY